MQKKGNHVRISGKDPLHELGPAERTLFLSLWVVLILAFAIWHFYPTFESREVAGAIPVEIGRELQGRIESAEISKSSPSQHWLRLQVARGYLGTLPDDSHRILLGYDLLNDKKVVYTGSVNFDLARADESIQLALPNPERVFTRRIRIYLPQR